MSMVGVELLPGAEADAVALAAEEATEGVVVDRNAAVVIVSAPQRLVIEPEAVRAHLGRDDWAGPDIQVIMASYFGFITQLDDERIVLEWLRRPGGELASRPDTGGELASRPDTGEAPS